MLALRATHRGQCLIASQCDLDAMLNPQRGQFRSVASIVTVGPGAVRYKCARLGS